MGSEPKLKDLIFCFMEDKKISITLLGGIGVGKTTLAHQYVHGAFKNITEPTLRVDMLEKKLSHREEDIVVQIADTSGQESNRRGSMSESLLKKSDGFMIVFDLTKEDSLQNDVNNCLMILKDVHPDYKNVPCILVGNKVDLVDSRRVTAVDIGSYSNNTDFKLTFFEVSSVSGEGVVKCFDRLVDEIIAYKKDSVEVDGRHISVTIPENNCSITVNTTDRNNGSRCCMTQ